MRSVSTTGSSDRVPSGVPYTAIRLRDGRVTGDMYMLVVTGGAGFIGSALVHALCAEGHDVAVVDDLGDPMKFENLRGAPLVDFVGPSEFLAELSDGSRFGSVSAVIHQGAVSSTQHHDGREVMSKNYEYTRTLLECCLRTSVPLIYASSAAVYGRSASFDEDPTSEESSQRLWVLEATRRPGGPCCAPYGGISGGGSALLQRLRPTRVSQGRNGEPCPPARFSAAVDGDRADLRPDPRMFGRGTTPRFRSRR